MTYGQGECALLSRFFRHSILAEQVHICQEILGLGRFAQRAYLVADYLKKPLDGTVRHLDSEGERNY